MNQSFKDQLKQWKRDHMQVKEQRKSKSVKRKPRKYQETFSERDIHDLMGTNKKILHRGKGGAFK